MKAIRAVVRGARTKSASRGSGVLTASGGVPPPGKGRGTPTEKRQLMLSIDPGLTGTGYVMWQWWAGSVSAPAPIAAGVLTAPAGRQSLGVRARVLADRLRVLQGNVGPWAVVCEFPEYQESSGRSMGWRTGDLQRLTFLIGVIAGRTEGTFIEVTPHVWKGQLPKSVVQQRVINQLGAEMCEMLNLKTHAWDAAGIGLWAIQRGVWP